MIFLGASQVVAIRDKHIEVIWRWRCGVALPQVAFRSDPDVAFPQGTFLTSSGVWGEDIFLES